jgi:hypothetical protein
MIYVGLNEFSAQLNAPLTATDSILPIANAQDLSTALGSNYTYLTLKNGVSFEIVRAEAFGNQVRIYRAEEGTIALNFGVGACVIWKMTVQSVKDICCQNECPATACVDC